MLPTSALEYHLPDDLIATRPAEPRERARLMVVRRSEPDRVEHHRVEDLPALLPSSATMVFNRTKVLPARFEGRNLETGGRVEGLWLGDAGEGLWHAMVRARRFRPGRRLELTNAAGEASGVILTLVERAGEEGAWLVRVEDRWGRSTPTILESVGRTPLPPYIRGARKRAGLEVPEDDDRAAYQTVFARDAGPGHWSVAAPTAGLHFTRELLAEIDRRGVRRAEVVLDVGPGTFKPIETETVEAHRMHAEWCSLGGAGWVLDAPGPVVAVGSTSARTLESFAAHRAAGRPETEWLRTELMIAPGYEWRRVDALVTNFHLPRSTLLLMVGAFVPGGLRRLLEFYAEAVEARYRFYSFGDAMLILP